jgi:hypothetical protein
MKPAKPSETQTHQVLPFGRANPYETTETTPLKGWFRGFGLRATQQSGRLLSVDGYLLTRSDFWMVRWIALVLIVLAVTGVGVLQNARYGMWLDAVSGSHDFTFLGIAVGSFFGVTFAILNLFKAIVPLATNEAWRRGRRACRHRRAAPPLAPRCAFKPALSCSGYACATALRV